MLTFLGLLAAGAAVPVVLFSSAEAMGLTGLSPISLASSGHHPIRRAAYGAWSVTQAYVWLGWAAYCASIGLSYAFNPTAGSPWVFVSVSLFATSLPIAYLRVQDRLTGGSGDEDLRLLSGSHFWRIVVLSGCICFWVAPHLMSAPYGWLSPVAPMVLGVERQIDSDRVVGASPARTTTTASFPQTPDRRSHGATHGGLGAAHAAPAVSSVAQADAPCVDDEPTGTEKNRPDDGRELSTECFDERSVKVGTND